MDVTKDCQGVIKVFKADYEAGMIHTNPSKNEVTQKVYFEIEDLESKAMKKAKELVGTKVTFDLHRTKLGYRGKNIHGIKQSK